MCVYNAIHTRTHIFYVNVKFLLLVYLCISKLTTRAKVRRAAAVFIMCSFVKSGIWVKTKLCKCSFHTNWPVLVHFPHVIFYSAPDKECRIPWNDKVYFFSLFFSPLHFEPCHLSSPTFDWLPKNILSGTKWHSLKKCFWVTEKLKLNV